MAQRNPGLLEGNPLKLGIFGPNCSGGLSFTTLPERWDASWEHNLELAKLADEAGLECIVPVGRWKGYGGVTDVNGTCFETITWATGLLTQTRRINIFGTVHAPLFHPVMAAKLMVTADQASAGRFGVNIVCGWNPGEFAMFGVGQQEHDLRYLHGEEWWQIVKRIWSGEGPFDHEGRFFKLRGLIGSPRPYGDSNPLMMNAGASPAGREFAIRNSDLHFDGVKKTDEMIARIKDTRRRAREQGHEIRVWTPVHLICRPTRRQVDKYLQRCLESADWEALDCLLDGLAGYGRSHDPQDLKAFRQRREVSQVLAYGGGYIMSGDPDEVAQELGRLHGLGFDGVVMSFINYLDDLPLVLQEVLPRLEQMGLRRPGSG